jgi:hypothetical protein
MSHCDGGGSFGDTEIAAINQRQGIAARALQVTLLTGLRTTR